MFVPEHCRNTANVSKILADFCSNREILKKYCEILAAVHDVGKISPGFQKKICPSIAIRPAEGFETNHALIGKWADERLKFIGDSEKQFGKLPNDGEIDSLNKVLL